MRSNVGDLLQQTKIVTASGTFTLLSLTKDEWNRALQNPQLGPRMTAPFMIFSDGYEVTLMLDEIDYAAIRDGVAPTRAEGGLRLLTFDIELDFAVVGFLAEVSALLADAGVPIIAVSAFTRDHFLINQVHLPAAISALRNYVSEVC